MDLRALPSDKPSKMYAGHGTGEPCAGCENPILPGQVEYEFQTSDGRTRTSWTEMAVVPLSPRLRWPVGSGTKAVGRSLGSVGGEVRGRRRDYDAYLCALWARVRHPHPARRQGDRERQALRYMRRAAGTAARIR
jgi:hypothetical protein